MENQIHIKEMICYLITKWYFFAIAVVLAIVVVVGVDKSGSGKADDLPGVDESYIQQLEALEAYSSGSILMQINPFEKHIGKISFTVIVDKEADNALLWQDNLASAYVSYVASGQLAADLSDVLAINSQYIDEALSVAQVGNNFIVSLVLLNVNDLETMVALIENALIQYDGMELDYAPEYQITLTDFFEVQGVDQALLGLQNTVTKQIEGLQTEISKQSTPRTDGFTKKALVTVLALWALSAVVLLLIYMYDGRLKEKETILSACNIQEIDSFIVKSDRKKAFRRFRYSHVAEKTLDEAADFAALKLSVKCESKRLVAATTVKGAPMPSFLDKIKDNLQKKNIEFCFVNSLDMDTKELEKVLEAGNVVLVEKIGESRKQNINKEISLMNDCNVQILGMVFMYE